MGSFYYESKTTFNHDTVQSIVMSHKNEEVLLNLDNFKDEWNKDPHLCVSKLLAMRILGQSKEIMQIIKTGELCIGNMIFFVPFDYESLKEAKAHACGAGLISTDGGGGNPVLSHGAQVVSALDLILLKCKTVEECKTYSAEMEEVKLLGHKCHENLLLNLDTAEKNNLSFAYDIHPENFETLQYELINEYCSTTSEARIEL